MERPLLLVRAAEEFAEAFDFEREVETVEPLLFIVRRFLDQLAARLGNVHRVAGRMALTLMLANGGTHAHTFTVPSPTADVDVLFRIVHTHLDGLRLDHAATGVRLLITPALAERQQFQLFESPLRDPNRFGETLGRLAALVGAENVGTAEVLDTHRPDSFRLRAPRFHEMNTANADADSFDVGLPLRRWRPPLVAEVRVVRQRPEFIVSEKVRGVIRDALGPYARAAAGGKARSGRRRNGTSKPKPAASTASHAQAANGASKAATTSRPRRSDAPSWRCIRRREHDELTPATSPRFSTPAHG